jgi:hypothetical protein
MALPRVFASYAQLDYDKHLRKFVDDLAGELAAQAVGHPESVVFFDRKGVEAGEKWSDVILDALADSGVLLCLMTPRYFTRPWCGRELQTFLERSSRLPAGAEPRFIFPVWWLRPAVPREPPTGLKAYLSTDKEYPTEYAVMGVRDMALEGKRTKIRRVVRRLAVLITQTLARHPQLPPVTAVKDVLEIANAFDEQQAFDVRVVALTQGGDAWRPNLGEPTLAEALETSGEAQPWFIRRIATGPGLLQSLHKAQDEQQVILLVVDAQLPVDATLRAINALTELTNLTVLLVDAGTPPVGMDAWVGQFDAGAFAAAQKDGRNGVAMAYGLVKAVEKTIFQSRTNIMGRAKPIAVRDDTLTERAREQGISVGTQPSLSGPSEK